MPEDGTHYEHEPLTPEQHDALRADIVLHMAEYGPGPIYAIAMDTGSRMINAIELLEEMEAKDELVRTPRDDIFRINPETQAQTYADVLPHVSTEQLTRLATIANRPRQAFGKTARELHDPLQIAVDTEVHARVARLGRITVADAT